MKPAGNLTGMLLFAGAVMLFTGLDTTAKWLMGSGLAIMQVAFVRYAGHLVITLLAVLPRQGLGALRSVDPKKQLLRSLALLSSTALNFVGLSYLPLTTVTAIMFASPVLVTLLAVPLLQEKVSPLQFVAIMLGFFGVLVVVAPWGNDLHWAILFSLGACICNSFYYIFSRMLARESTATQQIWASGIATICLAPVAFMQWQEPASWLVVVMMCAIGLFGAASHSLTTLAHRIADASVLAPVIYLQLLFATALGYLVFGQIPGPSTVFGAIIIVSGGVLLWLSGRRKRLAAVRASAIAISSEQSHMKTKEEKR
ncbi:DMT family transporter [Paracoccus shanxieyensis]|uniref:EamA family transporter n=1 Tax=Paracoccus shanxieyensis TaxID=2675752 RepID=A0A6L6J1I6_9RHOB|nr:DMT family transporter [Paracoccus shanxieyensis]MTH65282.1 EamA family transporter [Paracoccus shanxieyensis]MTH88414.1 EamA family transporter [Paracoccus shanxieyensis]